MFQFKWNQMAPAFRESIKKITIRFIGKGLKTHIFLHQLFLLFAGVFEN